MSQPLEQRLKEYQRRINELQSARNMPLEPERLRAIAAEYGLSDEDLAAADDIAYASFQRGEDLLATWDYDKALDAFADAVALRPDWLEYRAALARAYMARYEAHGRDHDRYRIIELTQDCLDVEPGYRPAVELINRLNARQEQAGQPQVDPQQYVQQEPPPQAEQPAQNEPNGCGLLILIFVGLTVCFPCCCLGESDEDYDDEFTEVVAPVPEPVLDDDLKEQLEMLSSAKPVVPAPVVTSNVIKTDGMRDKGLYTLSTGYVETEASEHLDFEVTRSHLKVHALDNAYYEFWLQMKNTSDQEIKSLKVALTLFADDGSALATKETHVVLSLMSAPVRPGETFGMRQLIKTDARARHASFEATAIQLQPAQASYPPSQPTDVRWTGKAAQGAESLTVRTRTESFSPSGRDPEEGFYKVSLELTNEGDYPLKRIHANATFKDGAGEVLDSQSWYLIGVLKMPILPGQTHTERRTFKVPSSFSALELEVTQLEFDVQEP